MAKYATMAGRLRIHLIALPKQAAAGVDRPCSAQVQTVFRSRLSAKTRLQACGSLDANEEYGANGSSGSSGTKEKDENQYRRQ